MQKFDWMSEVPFFQSYYDLANGNFSPQMVPGLIWDTLLIGAIGWLIAWLLEHRHLKKLAIREAELDDIIIEASMKKLDDNTDDNVNVSTSGMLTGSVVLSHDSFRSVTIMLRRIFGGQIKQYELLMSRARREAIIRLKEKARENGFSRVVNLKIVSNSIKRKGPKSVEIVVYGTGVVS